MKKSFLEKMREKKKEKIEDSEEEKVEETVISLTTEQRLNQIAGLTLMALDMLFKHAGMLRQFKKVEKEFNEILKEN